MVYRLHEGIVFTDVCEIPLLIATRAVWEKFPAVKRLSPLQAYFCRGVLKNMEKSSLTDNHRVNIRKEVLEKRYDAFLDEMIRSGYFVPEDPCVQ